MNALKLLICAFQLVSCMAGKFYLNKNMTREKKPTQDTKVDESSAAFPSSHASPGTRAPAPGLGCCPGLWRPLSSGFHGASLKPAHLSPQHLLRTETAQPGHGETASRHGDPGLCVWAAGCPHCMADGPVRERAPEHRPRETAHLLPPRGKQPVQPHRRRALFVS